jgi:predicted dithiol-disulfide oxidoreductase (DUF899 family)
MGAIRFPGESAEYRARRDALLEAEVALRRQTEAVAEQRRRLPLGGLVPTDYVFDEGSIDDDAMRTVRLSELFAPDRETLMLYSFMYGPAMATACPMCTAFIDAIDGELDHVSQRVGFALVARSPVERLRAFARGRGWRRARLLSSAGNSFSADYHAEGPDGDQRPLMHVFVRRGEAIRHSYTTEMYFAASDPGQNPRHIDPMWPLWNMLDLTPVGRGTAWTPSLENVG